MKKTFLGLLGVALLILLAWTSSLLITGSHVSIRTNQRDSAIPRIRRDIVVSEESPPVRALSIDLPKKSLLVQVDPARQDIFTASARGDIEAVKKYLSEGVDVNSRDELNRTPLYYAVAAGHAAVVRLLLRSGAVTKPSPRDWRPSSLRKAKARGHLDVVNTLEQEEAEWKEWTGLDDLKVNIRSKPQFGPEESEGLFQRPREPQKKQ